MVSKVVITSTRVCFGQVSITNIWLSEYERTKFITSDSDIFAMIAAIGLAISSGITLVVSTKSVLVSLHLTSLQIFFPRSIEGEIAARDSARVRRKNSTLSKMRSISIAETNLTQSLTGAGGTYLLTSSPVKQNFSDVGHVCDDGSVSRRIGRDPSTERLAAPPPQKAPTRSGRNRGTDLEMGEISGLTDQNLARHNVRTSSFNPMVHNFTSPISQSLLLACCS
jgi:hypothetical protein